MSDQTPDTLNPIELAKAKLELLEEIELLDSEYELITNEYTQRKRHFEERLTRLGA